MQSYGIASLRNLFRSDGWVLHFLAVKCCRNMAGYEYVHTRLVWLLRPAPGRQKMTRWVVYSDSLSLLDHLIVVSLQSASPLRCRAVFTSESYHNFEQGQPGAVSPNGSLSSLTSSPTLPCCFVFVLSKQAPIMCFMCSVLLCMSDWRSVFFYVAIYIAIASFIR